MKKWIVVFLIGLILPTCIFSTVYADTTKHFSYYSYVRSRRKAKSGQATLNAKMVIPAYYQSHGSKHKKDLVTNVTMYAYFSRKSKNSKVTVSKVIIKTKNKTFLPLYYSLIGMTLRNKKSSSVYRKRSSDMNLYQGSKVKNSLTIYWKRKVNKVSDVFAFLNNSISSVAAGGSLMVGGNGQTGYVIKKKPGSGTRMEYYVIYY